MLNTYLQKYVFDGPNRVVLHKHVSEESGFAQPRNWKKDDL